MLHNHPLQDTVSQNKVWQFHIISFSETKITRLLNFTKMRFWVTVCSHMRKIVMANFERISKPCPSKWKPSLRKTYMRLRFCFSNSMAPLKMATGLTGISILTPSASASNRQRQAIVIFELFFTFGIDSLLPKFLTVAAGVSTAFFFFLFLAGCSSAGSSRMKTKSFAGVIVESLTLTLWCAMLTFTLKSWRTVCETKVSKTS